MQKAAFSLARRSQELNWPVIVLSLLIGLIGIMMMLSAGGGSFQEFALPQFLRFVIAIGLMFVIALLPMRLLYDYAYIIYAVGVLTLVVVDVIGHIGMGAQRWIRFGGMNLQPSEFMKLAVVMALARYFHGLTLEEIRRVRALIIPVLIMVIPAILILRQPNLGTTTILLAVGGTVCFMGGVQLRYFVGILLSVLAAMPVAWQFLHEYQKRRVLTFLNPEQDPLGAGYNILQSMIAIGSGGLFGKGFLQGSQSQLNFLPEKHTDFIFTMLAEEWGFAGGVILLALFTLLLLSTFMIALSSRTSFGALIAVGVGALLFVHLFINVAMVMGMIPVVGLPLPFLSYGGSIMLSTFMAIGLLLNVCVHRDQQMAPRNRAFS